MRGSMSWIPGVEVCLFSPSFPCSTPSILWVACALLQGLYSEVGKNPALSVCAVLGSMSVITAKTWDQVHSALAHAFLLCTCTDPGLIDGGRSSMDNVHYFHRTRENRYAGRQQDQHIFLSTAGPLKSYQVLTELKFLVKQISDCAVSMWQNIRVL